MGFTNFGKAKPKDPTCSIYLQGPYKYKLYIHFGLVQFRPIRCMNTCHRNLIFWFQVMGNRNQTKPKFWTRFGLFGSIVLVFRFFAHPYISYGPSPNQMPKTLIWERERERERDFQSWPKENSPKFMGQNKNDP